MPGCFNKKFPLWQYSQLRLLRVWINLSCLNVLVPLYLLYGYHYEWASSAVQFHLLLTTVPTSLRFDQLSLFQSWKLSGLSSTKKASSASRNEHCMRMLVYWQVWCKFRTMWRGRLHTLLSDGLQASIGRFSGLIWLPHQKETHRPAHRGELFWSKTFRQGSTFCFQ